MANIFSSNQVNHAYVVNSYVSGDTKVTTASANGAIKALKHGNSLYFMYKGVGGLMRSDLIDNIMDVRYTAAEAMFRRPNTASVSINSAALSNSAPIVGQDYVLRVEFNNPIGMSVDNKYWKQGVAHAVNGETVRSLILKLAKSLAKSFAREAQQLIKIYVATSSAGADKVEVTRDSDFNDTTTFPTAKNYTHVILEEVEQPWYAGTKQQKPIEFTVENSYVKNGNVEVYWMDVVYENGKKVVGGEEPSVEYVAAATYAYLAPKFNNSKLSADLEYFSMGERGDYYRMVGFPNTIHTEYMVNPNALNGYDMINIHYAYTGSNHAVQKSEKDITFICKRTDAETTTTSLGAVATALKSAIEALINPMDDRYEPKAE